MALFGISHDIRHGIDLVRDTRHSRMNRFQSRRLQYVQIKPATKEVLRPSNSLLLLSREFQQARLFSIAQQ